MKIKQFTCNPLQENCYVVSDELSRQCVVIDCGAYYPEERRALVDYIRQNHLCPLHLLATHGHLDHNFGNDTLFDEFSLQVEVMAADLYLAEHLVEQGRQLFGIDINPDQPAVGRCLIDGETISFGDCSLRVLHTPGHTPGGVVLWCPQQKVAFTGDTLFRMSIGRTDFEGGSWQQMSESLQMLSATLPADTRIFAGHGPASLMADEISMNPYLR